MSRPKPPVYSFEHEAMATTFEVLIAGQQQDYAGQVAAEIFREIDHLEKILSRFDPGSDISMINRLRPGQTVQVALEVVECLEIAWRVRHETNGAFDITFASRREDAAPGQAGVTGMDWLAVLSEGEESGQTGFTVGIRPEVGDAPFPGLKIDLGALGKGYALDRASEILQDWDVDCALLNSGTSTVLAIGEFQEEGWPLGVGGRWGETVGINRVLLKNQALSGSGTDVKGQHILDPRTGQPAASHLAAWVAAPSAALSDALSTALFVMTPEEAEAFCAKLPEISALLVSPGAEGEVVRSYGEWKVLPRR